MNNKIIFGVSLVSRFWLVLLSSPVRLAQATSQPVSERARSVMTQYKTFSAVVVVVVAYASGCVSREEISGTDDGKRKNRGM